MFQLTLASSKILAVLGLATVASAAAMPQPNLPRATLSPSAETALRMREAVGEEGEIDLANYANNTGALAVAASWAAVPAPSPTLVKRSGPLTIVVINSDTWPISTSHAHNAGGPSAVSGNVSPGTIAAGATAAFAVPTGWAGNVAVVQYGSGRAIVGDESLIEASYVLQGGSAAVIDVDVSYVSGFSLAIVCSCDGLGVVTGCNKYLWSLHTCGNDNGVGSCR
jgi:hypothetical protein